MKKSIIVFSVMIVMVMLTGCKTTKDGISEASLTANAWELSSIEGKSVVADDYPNGLPDAVFASGNKISGHGGCNRYGGSYTLAADGKLTISEVFSTKMFCPGGGEERYMKAVGQANKAKIEGKNLVLYNDSKVLVAFVPKKHK